MSHLQKIRQRILDRDYFLSSHAEEEMLDDELEREDIENAILKGRIEKQLTHDIDLVFIIQTFHGNKTHKHLSTAV